MLTRDATNSDLAEYTEYSAGLSAEYRIFALVLNTGGKTNSKENPNLIIIYEYFDKKYRSGESGVFAVRDYSQKQVSIVYEEKRYRRLPTNVGKLVFFHHDLPFNKFLLLNILMLYSCLEINDCWIIKSFD